MIVSVIVKSVVIISVLRTMKTNTQTYTLSWGGEMRVLRMELGNMELAPSEHEAGNLVVQATYLMLITSAWSF